MTASLEGGEIRTDWHARNPASLDADFRRITPQYMYHCSHLERLHCPRMDEKDPVNNKAVRQQYFTFRIGSFGA